ncbi:MAG: Gfo/Idh/MocA family oxidoreductase [Candidatus Lokiarchaeota archaeon]|nr:Gfo/Idh/MocA family oxidoreductase [Candidatus Lokiarchaeota archaeon]
MKRVKVGIASFAHMHAFSYAQVLKEMGNVEIAGFCDLDEARAKRVVEEFKIPRVPTYEALAAQDDLDAVLVTTETIHHVEAALAAMERGKHVIVEKPIATRLDDATRMIDAAARHGVKLFQCYPCRYHPSAQKAKDAIASGEAGDILGITSTNHGRMPDPRDPATAWFTSRQLAGGGAVMDHATHAADLMFWFTGWTPRHVFGIARRLFHGGIDCDDAGMVLVSFENGAAASIDPSWSRPEAYPTWGDLTMVVYGTKMTIWIDMFNQNIDVFSGARGRAAEWRPFGSDANRSMLEHYVRAIADDLPPPVSGGDGLRALKVAILAYESNDKGTHVAW